MIIAETLLLLIFAHCLGDYAFQNQFIADAKNRNKGIKDYDWRIIMSAHCMIHAGLVFLVMREHPYALYMALVEFVAHYLIDVKRCDGDISSVVDQGLHILTKVLIFTWFTLIR